MIAVLDHHSQSSIIIENAVLSYIEPYSSSACEMVAEVLQYIVDDIKFPSVEAECHVCRNYDRYEKLYEPYRCANL